MKVYVVGFYKNDDRESVFRQLSDWHRREIITDVITGGEETGTDLHAMQWADENEIEYRTYKPDWKADGGSAAIKRNFVLYGQEKPDLILLFENARGVDNLTKLARDGKTQIVQVEE